MGAAVDVVVVEGVGGSPTFSNSNDGGQQFKHAAAVRASMSPTLLLKSLH